MCKRWLPAALSLDASPARSNNLRHTVEPKWACFLPFWPADKREEEKEKRTLIDASSPSSPTACGGVALGRRRKSITRR